MMISHWRTILEISVLWFVIYQIILFFMGTRAIHVVRGIIILLFAFLLAQRLGLERLEWLLTKMFGISVLAILVIFHPEIRQGLARLGRHHLFGAPLREEEIDYILREIAKAVDVLSRQGIGALIAIEREDNLKPYSESGVAVDAMVTSELLQSIFTPGSMLHDGGLVIQQGRVTAAGCLFPLNEDPAVSRIFGMRHRSAIALTQETDAIVIVVSEERRDISLAYDGKLFPGMKREDIQLKVKQLIKLKKEKKKEVKKEQDEKAG